MNQKHREAGDGNNFLFSLACVVVIVAGLKISAPICIPIAIGLFLGVLSLPLLNFLNHRLRIPRSLAILMTVFIDLIILVSIVYIMIGAIPEFESQKEKYAKRLKEQAVEYTEAIDAQLIRFERIGGILGIGSGVALSYQFSEKIESNEIANFLRGKDYTDVRVFYPESDPDSISVPVVEIIIEGAIEETEGLETTIGQLLNERFPTANFTNGNIKFVGFSGQKMPTTKELLNTYWDAEQIIALIGLTDVVERFTSLASKSFFVLILMIFVLAESQRYAEKVRDVIKDRGPDLRRFQNSSRDIQSYLMLKTAVSLLTGFLAWVTCVAMKIEFPVLWGLLAFLLNFIPVIGSIVAAIPPVALALIMQGAWQAGIVLAAYLAINMLIGNFLEPKLLGDSFGISTIVVILSVLFWGYVWGPAGMFLAVPLTMMVKVMLDNTPEMRWISTLISRGREDEEEGPPVEVIRKRSPETVDSEA